LGSIGLRGVNFELYLLPHFWIFLGFWKEEFFLYNFTYFFPENLSRGWAINYSLTISAIEHIFGFLEREIHCADLILFKVVDSMSRS